MITGLTGLTSQGESIGYIQVGDVLIVMVGGRDIFTVMLDGVGGYMFELLDMLDHASGVGQNVLNLEFGLQGVLNVDALALIDFDLDAVQGLADVVVN